VGAHLAVVFAPVYGAALVGPWPTIVLCWLWFGLLSQGALLTLHEAAHRLLLSSRRRNDLLARGLLAPLFFADFDAFRRRHWAHHRDIGLEGDPKYTYRVDVSGWRFVRLVLSSLALVEAVRRVRYQSGERSASTPRTARQALVSLVAVQTVFFVSLVVTAGLGRAETWPTILLSAGVAYLGVYLYGLASLGVLMHALRGIVEHRPWDPAEPRVHEAALRNFREGFVQKWLFAPYGFVEHATHHRHPSAPYYELPALMSAEDEIPPVGSHLEMLFRLVARRPVG